MTVSNATEQFDMAKYSSSTKVSNIEWILCSAGSYIPRIHFQPIEINGERVFKAPGFSYDYLIRIEVSIDSEVVVTLHGGVLPYISAVLTPGNGDLNLPKDILKIEKGDIDIWSTDSSKPKKNEILRVLQNHTKIQ